ncbi:MAG: flagellar FliJ family protein [bacterium]|nr:flagellar FliJ family protein [bacterium]
MKRFEFRLDKVMNYKKNIEEMKKQELAQAMRLLLEAQIKASQLKKYKSCQLEEMTELQEDDIYTRLLYDKYILALNFHIKTAEELIAERMLLSEQKRLELVEASKARRIFEKLKEKKIEEFNYERNKWEQAVEDECAKYVHNNQIMIR